MLDDAAAARPDRRRVVRRASPAELAAEASSWPELVVVGDAVRAVARRARRRRPRRPGRPRRRRAADVHVRDDRRPEGRPDDAPQPRRRGRDVAVLAVRRRLGQHDAAADVPHRRHRLGVPRPLERRDDDPRPRVRGRGVLDAARAAARHERRARPDDAAAADRGAGRGRSRLLGAALDRLRRLADHDAGAQGRAADVPLLALRHLRPDRESTGGVVQLSTRTTTTRTGRASTCCAPPEGRCRGWSCASSIRSTGTSSAAARSARCGCARRT